MSKHAVTKQAVVKQVAMGLLALLLPLMAGAAPPTAPVAGTDYVVIEGGTPYQPLDGKIEVVEVFAYWCHFCAQFQPKVDAWKRTLPANVRFTYLPLPYDANDALARAFFAAKSTGTLERTHDALFRAIHDEQTVPKNATIDEIAAFYARQGLDATRMKVAMQDPDMRVRLANARQFALRSGVPGTPTLIINGKYRVTGRSFEEMLQIASQLLAMQGTDRH